MASFVEGQIILGLCDTDFWNVLCLQCMCVLVQNATHCSNVNHRSESFNG